MSLSCAISPVRSKNSYAKDATWAMEHTPRITALIEGRAKVTSEDSDGQTPLHYFASWGHLNLVKLMVESECLCLRVSFLRCATLPVLACVRDCVPRPCPHHAADVVNRAQRTRTWRLPTR